ncbi:UDENN domain-containing protein [Plasmodiophora brassicae]
MAGHDGTTNAITRAIDELRSSCKGAATLLIELDQATARGRIEEAVRRELDAMVAEQRARFEREAQQCRDLAAELQHWKAEADKLAHASHVVQDRIRDLKASVAERRRCRRPRPVLKSAPIKTPDAGSESAREAAIRQRAPARPVGRRPERMFDTFAVIGADERSPATPVVQFRYPNRIDTGALDDAQLIAFAFPTGEVPVTTVDVSQSSSTLSCVRLGQDQFRKGANCHIFMHRRDCDEHDQASVYGVCVRVREARRLPDGQDGITEVAFCTMSRSPYFSVQFDMIERILAARKLFRLGGTGGEGPGASWVDPITDRRSGCTSILEDIYMATMPDPDHIVKVACPYELPMIVFKRPRLEIDAIREWCCSLAFSVSSSDTLVLILDLALREHSVIVVSDNLSLVSASVFAIVVMIAPLQWQGVLLPILPQSMEEFLQAPVPFIAGVQRLPAQIASSDDLDDNVAVWFPEQDDIWLPRRFHGRMPGADRLIDRLRPRLQALQSRSRKVLYTCNNAQAIAVNNVTSQVADVVQRLVDDDHADECEGEQDAADREYRQRLRATQMMTQWKATTLP